MVDPNVLLRDWLLSITAVTTLLGTNLNDSVYGGDLPEKFDADLGPGIQIFCAGGTSPAEIDTLLDARMQVRVWAGVEEYDVARAVYGAIRDAIHGKSHVDLGSSGHVIRCIETVPGQDITDPDTGWATVTAFYQLMARAN